ncbi:glycoside hydrolase family 71/99-like protein [Parapedobacter sp. 2B3]|uniref:glycoside hydrolase family 71/99-like protein n=1 Tax=Parapedobacter sp. 2B3 TaxID=3342381 RepID=UPI0035B696A1
MDIRMTIWLLWAVFLVGCKKEKPTSDTNKETKIETFEPVAVTKANAMKVWVHYMPWFEDKATSGNGKWGQHWTMANKNPDIIGADGKRQIASHYYPLIGPYASSDTDVLEYHFLLMKYAGIDGILIDWYGTRQLYDYPQNKRNTEAIVAVLEKVGLQYAIVYEDQTLRDGFDSDAQRLSQAVADMNYLRTNFFNDGHYIRLDGKPLLLTFGPQIINTPSGWNTVFNTLVDKPAFFTLYNHSHLANNATYQLATGEYIWVDATPMETKYARKHEVPQLIGGAYPGFDDYYKEGGWGEQVLGDIDHEDGALFDRSLQMATDENRTQLQLITWNDFGEGTMIEPTHEFQYAFLEKLQDFTGLPYNKAILEQIYAYYTLKKQFADQPEKQKQLLQAFYYLISLQHNKAMGLINEIAN